MRSIRAPRRDGTHALRRVNRQTGRVSDGSEPWVLHVDLDQFIAAVEVLRHPELAGRPVIVGGRGDPTERAVVSTASYEAREYGVGSGMPLRLAARKAPDAVILPVDAEAYTAASVAVMSTLKAQPGATVQVLGWDEAFIGVRTDDPEAYARDVQHAVLERTSLHCSIGIGDTLVRAKVATGFGKPRGRFRLTADNWLEVMGDRPTIDLWGVGTKISRRLAEHGIMTVAELAAADASVLVAEFGPKMGPWYQTLGRGEGARVVDDSPWVARGHSRETTYQQNLTDPAQIEDAVRELAAQVLDDVAAEGRPVIGLTLKVRYAPFITKTYQRKIPETFDRDTVVERTLGLLHDRLEPGRPVRLLGLRAEMPMPDDAREGHTPTRSGW
jgi:DNA polymerase IV